MTFFDRAVGWARRAGKPAALRGRVHKVSVVRGGEVSVVVRFGIDEPHARALNQGTLVEVVPHTVGKLAAAVLEGEKKTRAPDTSQNQEYGQ